MKLKIFAIVCAFIVVCFSSKSFAEGGWLSQSEGYEQAKQQSLSTGKPMLLYFYADWCPYCRKFEKNVLSRPEMQNVLNGYWAVRVNPEKSAAAEQLAVQYRVDGYPTVILESMGKKIKKRDISRFTQSPDKFAEALKSFEEKSRGAQKA